MAKSKQYPQWVCLDCGNKYGNRKGGLCTVHHGTCGVCGKDKIVTEPRDFGHLKPEWNKIQQAIDSM